MNVIAAVDKNWALGKKNQLLVRIPEDQKFFRRMTTGKVIVMGRRTLESFPNGLPLRDRVNIVLTHDSSYHVRGAITVNSLDSLREKLKDYPDRDIYVAGGGKVYAQLLDWCDTAYITKIDYEYDADTYFPDLDRLPEWKAVEQSGEKTYFDLEYYFCRYTKEPVR